MAKLIWFHFPVSFLFLVASTQFSFCQDAAPEGSKSASQGLPANVMSDEFIKEMVKLPISGAYAGGREKRAATPDGDVVTHTRWDATVDGRFDAEKLKDHLTIRVDRNKDGREKDGSGPVTIHACAPITGTISCDIKSFGKRNVKFKATACLEIAGVIRHRAGSSDQFEVKTSKWTGDFEDLTLDPSSVGILDHLADQATKKVLTDSAVLTSKATISLSKAPSARAALAAHAR